MRSTLRNFCKLGLTPARSSDPKKKRVEGNGNDNDKTKAKRQRRDREETEKRQRRDREETEKRDREETEKRDREETEKRDREETEKRDREETEKRQRRDREETEKRQRRDREETENRQRRDREQTEKRQRRDRETKRKRKVRSTLHNFFELRLARVPSDHPKKKKSAIHSPQFLSTRPSTCSRFRPLPKKKRKVRSTLHNFWKLGLAPVPGSDPHKKKEKCDPLSTISVSSSWHLLEVLYFFFALPCASTEKKNEKKNEKKKTKKKKRTYIAQEFPRVRTT